MEQHISQSPLQLWANAAGLQSASVPVVWHEPITHFFLRVSDILKLRKSNESNFTDVTPDISFKFFSGCFPVLKCAIGDYLFVYLVNNYLHYCNSSDNTDNENDFVDFLQATRPDRDMPINRRERWPDFIIETAKLEDAVYNLTGTIPHLNFVKAQPTTPDYQLQLSANLKVFHFHFPVHKYYKAVMLNELCELPLPRETFIALVRKNDTVGLIGLKPFEYVFLRQLKRGVTIEEGIEFMSKIPGMDNEKAVVFWNSCRETWINWGFFSID